MEAAPVHTLNQITPEQCANLSDDNAHIWLRENLAKGSRVRGWPTVREFEAVLVSGLRIRYRKLARFTIEAFKDPDEHKEPVATSTATMEHIMPKWRPDEVEARGHALAAIAVRRWVRV